jgi:hypothetical protein
MVLTSSANSDHAEDSIVLMGRRLAEEVVTFITTQCSIQSPEELRGLSFVAHSLGGLVARAALEHLEEYSQRMHLFLTLATPHLGYAKQTQISGWIVNAAVQILRKLDTTSACLKELTHSDQPDADGRRYLDRQARSPCLSWFRHVAFVSSVNDSFVQTASALAFVGDAEVSAKLAPQTRRIGEAMAKYLDARRVLRLHVDFGRLKSTSRLDWVVGRAPHIEFLLSHRFVGMFCAAYPNLFD